MRVLRVLLFLALLVAVVGFFRGWFSFSSQGPDASTQKVDINLTVDPQKMKDDADKVREKTNELTE